MHELVKGPTCDVRAKWQRHAKSDINTRVGEPLPWLATWQRLHREHFKQLAKYPAVLKI